RLRLSIPESAGDFLVTALPQGAAHIALRSALAHAVVAEIMLGRPRDDWREGSRRRRRLRDERSARAGARRGEIPGPDLPLRRGPSGGGPAARIRMSGAGYPPPGSFGI